MRHLQNIEVARPYIAIVNESSVRESVEQIVATDPPQGNLDTFLYGNLDRFIVTYDSPNYIAPKNPKNILM